MNVKNLMPGAAQKEEHLIKEIGRSILLSKEDKKFWISQIKSGLPDVILSSLLEQISKNNSTVDSYLDAAIAAGPDNHYLNELKAKVNQIKNRAFEMDESAVKKNLEKDLETKLEEI
jgi:hypothetical protein